MKQFITIDDVENPLQLAYDGIKLKTGGYRKTKPGSDKVLGLVFFNSSLRTRMSMTRAAYNLGMHVMTLNVSQDSWQLETEDGVIMNTTKAEHIREAAAVMGNYCDILGVRSFPTLEDKEKDYTEHLVKAFAKFGNVPVINMESATVHPLQSLADLMTILENKKSENPKVVMTWAPHVKSLPQSVPNSFAQWMIATGLKLTICQPKGLELSNEFTNGAEISYDQDQALKNADFVYVKNWSSFHEYGKAYHHKEWMVTAEKMELTNEAFAMHCLPVRRNVVISDEVLDSDRSIVLKQAENRVYSAQIVLKKIIEEL
jgi:N-succinyl-L-ornithine transcarbamylase